MVECPAAFNHYATPLPQLRHWNSRTLPVITDLCSIITWLLGVNFHLLSKQHVNTATIPFPPPNCLFSQSCSGEGEMSRNSVCLVNALL